MKLRWLIGITLACVTGCGFPAAKVEEARAHVQRSLEVWKSGEKAESVKSLTPSIEFNEALWSAGEKLIDFEMVAARYVETAKVVRCEVRLTLKNRKGKERKELISYDVTLGPPVKVVNNPMP